MKYIDFNIVAAKTIFCFSFPKDLFFCLFQEINNFNFLYNNNESFQILLHNKLHQIILENNFTHKDESYRALFQILIFFKKTLNYNEYFSIYIPTENIGFKNIYRCQDFVKAHQFNLSFNDFIKQCEITKQISSIETNISNFYYSFQAKGSIGETKKELRSCRFCNQKEKEYFKHKSHTIPEAIGNKSIISLEECDLCNKKFGETIERDFIHFFDFARLLNKQKMKKGGLPKIKGKNYELCYKTLNGQETLFFLDFGLPNENNNFKLKHPQKINLLNLYKALCKFSIGSIDRKDLHLFKKNIEWINSTDNTTLDLPSLKLCYSSPMDLKHPLLIHYMKKDDVNDNFPQLITSLSFYNITIIFITPTFNESIDSNFLNTEKFNSLFPHLSKYPWTSMNVNSSNVDLNFNFNINIKTS